MALWIFVHRFAVAQSVKPPKSVLGRPTICACERVMVEVGVALCSPTIHLAFDQCLATHRAIATNAEQRNITMHSLNASFSGSGGFQTEQPCNQPKLTGCKRRQRLLQ